MFLSKERFLSYFFSLCLLTIFINTIPIPQLPKYILFILINFFFFICPNNKFFYKDKKFIFNLIIFIFLILITNITPIKFSIKVNSFGNTDYFRACTWIKGTVPDIPSHIKMKLEYTLHK